MAQFKKYLESEEKKDVKRTLEKIPEKHARLVKNYEIVFQPSNTLKGDDKHIGLIDEKRKKITISAPWNYGREYTLLHEIGHAVWKFLLDEGSRKEWKALLEKERAKSKKNLGQEDEEIFCMIYAQVYAKNKIEKYRNKNLVAFVSKI
jgi:hypothetical protein